MAETTVVTFRADDAEQHISAFVRWAGTTAAVLTDMGVCDGVRRIKVKAAQWASYTRDVCKRATTPPAHLMRMRRCAEPGCKVRAVPAAVASHQKASGHEGYVEETELT
jgi:hypothetical protein